MAGLMIVILLGSALIFGWLATKVGLARVVGQLLAGIIVGPALLGWVDNTHLIHLIAEAGVLLLMVNAGLETDVAQLKANFKAATFTAVLGVVLPLIAFPVVALLLGYNMSIAIFWGIVFAATSISITIAVLGEQRKLGTQMGAIVLGAAVLDDIIALLLVTVYAVFAGGGGLGFNTLLPIVAFIVGLCLRRFAHADKLLHGLEQFGQWTLFPIFFGSIGLSVLLGNLANTWLIMIVLTILAVVTKYYGAGWGARLAGVDIVNSRAIGAGMVSRGEMALVIAQIGAGSGVLSEAAFGEFIIVIIASTIIAPLLMRPLVKRI